MPCRPIGKVGWIGSAATLRTLTTWQKIRRGWREKSRLPPSVKDAVKTRKKYTRNQNYKGISGVPGARLRRGRPLLLLCHWSCGSCYCPCSFCCSCSCSSSFSSSPSSLFSFDFSFLLLFLFFFCFFFYFDLFHLVVLVVVLLLIVVPLLSFSLDVLALIVYCCCGGSDGWWRRSPCITCITGPVLEAQKLCKSETTPPPPHHPVFFDSKLQSHKRLR